MKSLKIDPAFREAFDKTLVLWPRIAPPEIFELKYCFEFCKKISEDLLNKKFTELSPSSTIGDLVPSIEKNSYVLLVSDPKMIIPHEALRILIKVLEEESAFAVGPTFNISENEEQRAMLSFGYQNLSTYLELVREKFMEHSHNRLQVKGLDPACILLRAEGLKMLSPELEISRINQAISAKKRLFVAQGAFVHRFGGYAHGLRMELVSLAPEGVKTVLDVGCGLGGYGKSLKESRPGVHLTGIELNPVMAREAEKYYDRIIVDSVENLHLSARFDLINCGDILEHLVDPWEMLRKFHEWLNPGGYLTGSVPNMGHWTVARDLLSGDFLYLPWGLTCVGHLRFFTEDSLMKALKNAGFELDSILREIPPASPKGEEFIKKAVTQLGANENSLRTAEIIFRARSLHSISI